MPSARWPSSSLPSPLAARLPAVADRGSAPPSSSGAVTIGASNSPDDDGDADGTTNPDDDVEPAGNAAVDPDELADTVSLGGADATSAASGDGWGWVGGDGSADSSARLGFAAAFTACMSRVALTMSSTTRRQWEKSMKRFEHCASCRG